jgi:Tol biopolymer transport system component
MIVLVVALGGSAGIGAKGAGPLPERAPADDAEKPSGVTTLLGDPAAASGEARPRANGLIAFASGYAFRISGPHAVSQIWVVKPNGRGLRRLTEGRVSSAYPAWSPDGKRIAFFRDSGDFSTKNYLFVMNADGSDQTNLTNYPGRDEDPSWSPNGQQITFHRDVDPQSQILQVYTMNADGSNLTQLTGLPGDPSENGHPGWGRGPAQAP